MTDSGFFTISPTMTLEGLSVLTITYKLVVNGSSGQSVGGSVKLSNLNTGGSVIDEDEASNPIVG